MLDLIFACFNNFSGIDTLPSLSKFRFMLSERIRHKDTCPLLSCSDIEELLARFLPRRDVTEEEIIFQLEQRHFQRQKAIDSHARRQKEFFEPKSHHT